MKRNQLFLLTILSFIVVLNFSCQKEVLQEENNLNNNILASKHNAASGEKTNVFKGPQIHIGNGHVRSWVKLTHDNEPVELGIEFTPSALEGLPEHGEGHHFMIPLHQKALEATPYKHVSLNWNPEGHAPTGIFTLPHFDAHFMRITYDEQMAIPEYSLGSAFDNLPATAYRPAGYFPFPGGIAQMGKHWGSIPLPAPGAFTSVLIYGSYNGRMIFEEPMVTRQYMLNGGASNISFGQPTAFHSPGYYPTKYNVYTASDGHYHITLSHFVPR